MPKLVSDADAFALLQAASDFRTLLNRMLGNDIQQARDAAKHGCFIRPLRRSPEELELIGRAAARSPATRIALIRAIRSVQRANAIGRQPAPREDGLGSRVVLDQSQREGVTAQLAAIAIFRLHKLGDAQI